MALSPLQFKLSSFSIGYEATKLKHKLWWKLMPGSEIVVRWPVGWTDSDRLGNQIQSADPNDHYRPWMEANVGQQCWDWDWNIKHITDQDAALIIKFRLGRRKEAMQAKFMWG